MSVTMADDVLRVLEITSTKSQKLFNSYNKQYESFFAYLENIVDMAKECLNDDGSVSPPTKGNHLVCDGDNLTVQSGNHNTGEREGNLAVQNENHTAEETEDAKEASLSNGKIDTENSPSEVICQNKTAVDKTFIIPLSEIKENDLEKTHTIRKSLVCSTPHNEDKASEKKSCGFKTSTGGKGSVRVLASSKASRRRSQFNLSMTPQCGKKSTVTPGTYTEKAAILCATVSKEQHAEKNQPPAALAYKSKLRTHSHDTDSKEQHAEKNQPLAALAYKSKLRTHSHETEKEKATSLKSEHVEAVVKKFALMKSKVEEQKKKRELKVERNLQARELIKKEKEERLKRLELKEKPVEKKRQIQRGELKNKRKLTNRSDDEVTNSGSIKKIAKIKATLPLKNADDPKLAKDTCSPPVPEVSSITNAKVLNVTYVSDDPVKDKTPEKKKQSKEKSPIENDIRESSSYNTYEISHLRNSDDSDDDSAPTKPVPKWATGLCLKEALLSQGYNPPNVRVLFGKIQFPPDEMFGLKKKKVVRTSSAIWCSPDA